MDIQELKRLAGIQSNLKEPSVGENISHTGTEKAEYQRKHNIRPGTDEWFKQMFPLNDRQMPVGFRGRKK